MKQNTFYSDEHSKYLQYVLPALLLCALLYLFILTRNVLLPFILSATLAYILNPIVKYFVLRGIKRIYVVAGLYILVGLIVFVLGYAFINIITPQFMDFYNSWPIYVDKVQVIGQGISDKVIAKYPFLAQLQLQQRVAPLMTKIPQYTLGALPALSLLFLVPFITFFMLIGWSSVVEYILDHIPSTKNELFLHLLSRIDASLGNYLRGILTEAFLLFLLAFLGLSLMGLNYASVLALTIGLSGLIPYLGAFVGAVIASIVAYFQFGTFISVANVLLFFCAIRFFDDWFMQPFIMKRAVELNPALIIFALMAGWEIAGFWGIVFSIPVTCVLKELLLITVEIQETEFRWKPKPEPMRASIPYT